MYIEEMNQPVMKLDDSHPAKKFLNAFIACRLDCVGQELGLDGQRPIDQSWRSATDGKAWTFSAFGYSILSFDIELDGFLTIAPILTESETAAARDIPWFRALMYECAAAAQQDANQEILELTDQVLIMLSLWEDYLEFRREMVSRAHPNG